ncbi:PPOX class F420-dependent oxidoreductase [Amycolatopsis sp. FDAARGOS 1241]|uniref:PPOX class F420-dependent oxidoreductase n=1 Tax=Amycolatopsis sp. FDAARGOS 1241 TaxID=2778070 RepID=UPI00194DD7E4|nr:PPOX class F420-dependent oxidoreductase [Amycolatopsis sp. FDAARGOS 1241]QRP43512.1 PPOX class F420-dependent oxidoreductase [Amycolatopsis sp. FDAARGOS 1241]
MELPAELLTLLEKPSLCFIATSMPDGSPQLTQTWVDTDGKHVLVNTVEGFRKVRNVARDPRVALNVVDAERPYRYFAVRGRVLEATTEGGAEHIEKLAQRYTGRPYAWYGGRDQVRVLWKIEAEHINSVGG